MELTWESSQPPPTDADLDRFERTHGIRIIEDHRWFLKNVANGGSLVQSYLIPTTDCPGGASSWHSVYGINHTEPIYDLAWAPGAETDWEQGEEGDYLARYVPLGSDDTGGVVLIDVAVNVGQVVYNPRDPYGFYYSADSIHHFLDTLVLDDQE